MTALNDDFSLVVAESVRSRCRDLVREFTTQRLDQVRERVKRQFPKEVVEPLSFIALTLEIPVITAGEMRPELEDHFLLKFTEYFLEEGSSERLLQFQEAAAVTVH